MRPAEALAADLRWLEEKGLIGTGTLAPDAPLGDMPVAPVSDFSSATHAYSDLEPFKPYRHLGYRVSKPLPTESVG